MTERVDIMNVSGCDLVTILDSVKSKWFVISSQSLVQAMESCVEELRLYTGLKLDNWVLMEYTVQGKWRCNITLR